MKDNLEITTDSIVDADQYVAITLKDKCIEVHASVTSPANALGLYAGRQDSRKDESDPVF